MSDTKKRKVKNIIFRWFRKKVRDPFLGEIEQPAEEFLGHIEEEIIGLLAAAVLTGVFANIDDALAWLKEKLGDLTD